MSSLMKPGRMALPSSGGRGSRLKVKRRRLSEKRIDSGVTAPAAQLPGVAAVTAVKFALSGA